MTPQKCILRIHSQFTETSLHFGYQVNFSIFHTHQVPKFECTCHLLPQQVSSYMFIIHFVDYIVLACTEIHFSEIFY